ncbi:bifunctional hydroxymethylpyrimidine kinase/phosphomethylpyrimidine kinase [Sulfurimonas sp. SAG-AH-194-I05]|nr:bifunctional hydroxymethylpyrimidine kinase/phosphomethylpyrimidine kinase [Sulfurimonas sp. SAG-AH-194-I05]MDF1875549.1 bifunctional hydroxymethylpyrimidine kinase/phosphomethylpyrimidine kinase [Sulfurimonas sp. SAG-AH-194-I05]
MSTSYCSILTIAGSDSGGCAGIQADIKSISANGGYGASVITATTAQNTQGVIDIHAIPVPHIVMQMQAVLDDIHFSCIKIGMLHSSEVIKAVQNTLEKYKITNIILDPVMIATSGDKLLNDDAVESLKAFLPHVTLITPNIPEAELLIGHSIDLENIKESAKELAEFYHTSVLLKGGHLELSESMTDVLYNYENKKSTIINNKTVETINTHGTGCSLSSSIATFVGLGFTLEEACIKGCGYLNMAIDKGKDKILGKGHGPIHHFFKTSIKD